MKARIEYIDWAKGYAIFTIVCYHALQRAGLPPVLQQGIIFGGTGVHLFFLLSGFGLGLSRFSGSPLQFYRRRLTKVWLPYVLALTISLLAAIFFGLFPDRFDAWLAGVGLYQMFSERYIESFGGHFWFISAIIQFYLAYPVLVWIKNQLSESFKLS
ncbi:MAG TPA: acyltransferase, partial [Saprospiraceae bacterium]|nr:acyltransferase [Saprospiraceae bacterium]